MDSDAFLRRKKCEKELMVARVAIEVVVKEMMNEMGLTYSLSHDRTGVVLQIKMSHRRMIKVRLNRINYMKTMQNLVPIITTLIDVFDQMGSMNVTVCHAKRDGWVKPQTKQIQ